MVSAKPAHAQGADRGGALRLAEFEPRSMLQVPQSPVQKARFPVIDFPHSSVLESILHGPDARRRQVDPNRPGRGSVARHGKAEPPPVG